MVPTENFSSLLRALLAWTPYGSPPRALPCFPMVRAHTAALSRSDGAMRSGQRDGRRAVFAHRPEEVLRIQSDAPDRTVIAGRNVLRAAIRAEIENRSRFGRIGGID